MFDPLSSAFVYLLTAGLKKLSEFLAEHDVNLSIEGWGSLLVAALVSAVLGYANNFGATLPPTWQSIIVYVVTVLVILLPAIGIHAVVSVASNLTYAIYEATAARTESKKK